MELLKETKPIARKEHICNLCYGKIEKGEKYVSLSILDGDIYTFKMHLECEEVSSDACEHYDMTSNYDEGFNENDFQLYLDEWYDEFGDKIEPRPNWNNISTHEKVKIYMTLKK